MKLPTTLRATRRSWLPLPLGEGWGEGTHGAGLAADASPPPPPNPTRGGVPNGAHFYYPWWARRPPR